MSAPLLKVDTLSLAIGATPILKSVSLDIAAGEILGLVGASGSGKTLTALSVMRLLPHAASLSGSILLDGEALTEKTEAQMRALRGRRIGMIFQEPMTALNPLMRVGTQVAETLRLHTQVSAAEAKRAAGAALEVVGLSGEDGVLNKMPYALSGGQRQRAAIAMAVIMAPPLLIADEPTTALDAIAQAQVLRLLKSLVRERGMGLLLVTHDLAAIAQIADRLAVMRQGEIVEQGATFEVLRHARHPYTQALLAAANLGTKPLVPRAAHVPGVPGELGATGAPGVPGELGETGAPGMTDVTGITDVNVVPSTPGRPDDGAVLQVSGIVRDYPRMRTSLWHAAAPLRAVDGVSLCVYAGETVGLVGESGSGKTTLLKVLLALEKSQAGEVRLLGEEFSVSGAQLLRQRRNIQAVFQNPYGSFDPRWPVERLVAEPFFVLASPPSPAERRRRVAEVLEQVGLAAADARRLPREFSGGERQRIAIARALITRPKIILLDEAISALDVLVRAQILELLAQLKRSLGVAYLFVSHDLRLIRAIADRVYVMRRGRIVEEGTAQSVFSGPRHEYTRSLIAAAQL
jgi:peptide/nickel transport system ATP-binding protein